MIKKGRSLDEFMTVLKSLNTKTRTIISSGSKEVRISMKYSENMLESWKIESSSPELSVERGIRGKKYDAFMEALERQIVSKTLFDVNSNDSVLCYRDSEMKKEHGKIVSNWFEISPAFPFVISMDGQPKFKVQRLLLTEWEYERMMETQLAFFHDGKCFPLMKESLHSVGTKLDCSAAFKYQDDCQLGPALLLAEKFSRCSGLQVQYRKCTNFVYPVLSVSGMDYVHISLPEFYKRALAEIPGIYTPIQWSVNDIYATLDLSVQNVSEDCFIRIEAGDLPGKSMEVSAIAVINGCDVPIRTNKAQHNGSFESYTALFDGIMDAFEQAEQIRKDTAIISCPNLKPIQKILGIKRSRQIDFCTLSKTTGTRIEVLKAVIAATHVPLPVKQQAQLRKVYAEMLKGGAQ